MQYLICLKDSRISETGYLIIKENNYEVSMPIVKDILLAYISED
jgi:hypothetical protein